MTRRQNLGPGSKKIELERRLDANQAMAERAGRRPAPTARGSGERKDPNETVREALDKGRC